MEKYVPYLLLASVFIVGAVGLTLNLTEDTTANVVDVHSCKAFREDAVSCLSENGGCPKEFPPLKQYGLYIGNMPKCCCVPLKTEQQFKWGQSLYK